MRRNRPLKRFAPLLAFFVAAAALAQDDSAAIIARIESPQIPDHQGLDSFTLPDLMRRFHVPAMSIAVVRDFKIHWAKAYGVADVESGAKAETTTTFQAASISKPITAMAAMRLVENGRFKLDDDINTILKSWHAPPVVTPRSLMSHTSGADDGFGFPGYDPSAPVPTLVQVLDGKSPSNGGPVLFARPPYQAYKYSGGGVTVMQLALSDLTHQPFARMMRELVLDPLKMSESSYEQPQPPARAAHSSHAHDGQGKPKNAPWHIYPEQAAAGLWTTPTDLAKFIIEVQQAVRGPKGAVLSQQSASAMITPIGVGPYAIGLDIERRGEGWYFQHSGGNWGFICDMFGHVRKGYGLAIMTNSDSGGPLIREIESRIAAAYNWDSLDKPLQR